MRLHAIACEVLSRECLRAAEKSPHVVDLYFLPIGLHDRSDELRAAIQKGIDEASGRCDYILVAFGLCGGATAGLVARETPFVIPRAHECITILVGSRELYLREFGAHPGTYYLTAGWIDRKPAERCERDFHLMRDTLAVERYEQQVHRYGVDNACYLAQLQEVWLAKYKRAAFVNSGLGDVEYYRGFSQEVARCHGWTYAEIPGDLRLIDNLFAGRWDPEEVLIVQPGQRTVMDCNSHIISAV